MEKNRKMYATSVKSIVLMLQSIFAITLVIFLVLLSSCINKNMLNLGDLRNSSFVDSGYFEKTFQQQSSNVLSYLQLRFQLETDGIYDKNKVASGEVNEESVNLYKKYFNKYEYGASNLYYWLGKNDGTCIYTNMGGVVTENDAWNRAEKLGKYLYFDQAAFYFESNVGGMDKSYYRNMTMYNNLRTKDPVLVIAVDEHFAFEDDFMTAKKEFEKLYPWAKLSIIFIIAGGIGWLFCLCYMTLAAGRRSEDNEIRLFQFDKIKAEVLVAMILLGCACLGKLGMMIRGQDYTAQGRMVASGALAFIGSMIFMACYLSLVRQMKKESLLHNSLIYWCVDGLRDFMRHHYLSGRMLIAFWTAAAGCLVLGYLAFYRGYIWAFLLIALVIFCVFLYFNKWVSGRKKIQHGIQRITDGDLSFQFDLNAFSGDEKVLADSINHIGEGLANATSESVRDERMKANMITNVSHDLKTPLTAIINYVGLLKREEIDNENAVRYIEVLEQKAFRLKALMEDLVEVSKISSGNITLHMDDIDLVELVRQTGGEFNEKFENQGLNVVSKFPQKAVMINADGRQIWRVIGNLYNNVVKYAMPNTRVYVEISEEDGWACFSIKNISEHELKLPADDLTERFVRGDVARTTEGSGLGLSIAKTLTELMHGHFEVGLDGDVFQVKIKFWILA